MGFYKDLVSKASPESSMRYCLVFTYLFTVITVLGNWGIKYLFDKTADLPTGVITFASSIIAMVTAGKVVQVWGERDKKDGA